MTKKPKPSAVEIAEKYMPGWKAVEPSGPIKRFGAPERDLDDAAGKAVSVDAVMPSTRQLRAKFLGEDAANLPDDSNASPIEPEVELVDMKSGDLERTVGVNQKTGKIDWSQG
jgi:hypothetical protein